MPAALDSAITATNLKFENCSQWPRLKMCGPRKRRLGTSRFLGRSSKAMPLSVSTEDFDHVPEENHLIDDEKTVGELAALIGLSGVRRYYSGKSEAAKAVAMFLDGLAERKKLPKDFLRRAS